MGLRTKIAKYFGYEKIRWRPPGIVTNCVEGMHRVLGDDVRTVFDVGAYDGCSARRYRKKWPGCTVHAFEPAPDNFARLQENTDPFIRPVPLALSDTAGEATFHVNRAGMTNSLLANADEAEQWVSNNLIERVETVTVAVDTIDAYCAREGIEQIDLLKIDAQGADLQVLKGAEEMLKKGAIRAIFVEVASVPLYAGQAELNELYTYVQGFGYRLFDLFDQHYSEEGQLLWADLLLYRAT